MPKYVMWGHYCDNVLEKRAPYREAHLAGLSAQKQAGTLLTLGPTQDTTMVFGLYEAESEAQVRAWVEGDPYWQHGIWTDYQIREWIQAF
ncbi:YciI family protein [Lyngbya confervoides]|uniref:YciI family protein n=1 Tax=Lyngbya confervoides BDU141951 TaxID=1574623 RepID=A0ABD4T4M4_9CYAN|nr:YciI family protein [Lyngbya confervoides]MCM1983400.1 YciI family protein [Lyngbya confervoides BDU141951]